MLFNILYLILTQCRAMLVLDWFFANLSLTEAKITKAPCSLTLHVVGIKQAV